MSFGGYGLNPNGPSATGQKQSSSRNNAADFLSRFAEISNKSRQGEHIPEGYELSQLKNFTPEMMELFKSLFPYLNSESLTGQLAQGDESSFQKLEAPAMKQFSELQGGLASRFSGLGGQGALSSRKSSGFQNVQNQAAQDFAKSLQSQRIGLQSQAQQDLFNMASQLLGQRPFEKALVGEKGPSWAPVVQAFAHGAGNAVGQKVSGG